jgi:hypothetical protein
MRDAQRFFALSPFIYSLNITASSEFPINVADFEVKPVKLLEFSHYGTYSRGTRWSTAHSRSEVTVPMLRAT